MKYTDIRISLADEKYNKLLFEMLGDYCDKKPKDVLEFSRDKWLDSKEALEYGIIDEVIEKLEKK